MLYDQFGHPIDVRKLEDEEATATATGVRNIWTSNPSIGLDPYKLARILMDATQDNPTEYLELAEEMEEKDLHYASVLSTRRRQVSGLEVTVEAASDSPQDVKAADLVREAINRSTLQDDLFDMLDAIGKGYSATEIIWKKTAQRWMPERLIWRDPRWFAFDRETGQTLHLLTAGGQREPLSPYKYIVHIHKTKSGLPIRGGMARPAAWAYLFKNFDIKNWVMFTEACGQPLRVGKYGPSATPEDKRKLLTAVRNISTDAAAIIPAGMDIQFIEAKITGSITLFEKFADWFDKQVSKLVLGQTGTTDVGQHVGTANAHEQVREDIEADDARQLGNTLTAQLVRPIVDLNMGPQAAYPRIVIYRPDSEDVSALAENLTKLVPLGLRVEESWVRDRMGIPDPGKDAVLLAQPASVPPAMQPAAAAQRLAIAAQQLPPDETDAIDELVAEELGPWEEIIDPLIESIRALADETETAEDFLQRLPELAAKIGSSALTESLARSMFAARLAGETEAPLSEVADGAN